MKKVLILNGSHSEIPLIKAAKSLGFFVITSGNDPSLIGHQHADDYYNTDFSDKNAVLDLCRELNVDGIISAANDFGALTASYVAEKLGYEGHDSYSTTVTLHHKDRFKAFAEAIDLKTPKAKSFDSKRNALDNIAQFTLPVIVKPIDLTGGKGITKANTQDQLIAAIDKAFNYTREGKIVIEDFFVGTQHSFSAFIKDQKVLIHYTDNEFSSLNPYLVSTSSAPAANNEKYVKQLIQESEKVANELQIVDGVLHSQYLANEDDFTIIEMTRRCSGDLYPLPVQLATKVDWAELIVRSELAMPALALPEKIDQNGFVGRHCLMAKQNGLITEIFIADELKPYINASFIYGKTGEHVENYLQEKFGVLILSFPTKQVMDTITQEINNLAYVRIN